MRSDWVPISASALVVGVLALVFGALLNPTAGSEGTAETIETVAMSGGRWLGMAVMYAVASVAMTLGLPAVLTLFQTRGRRLGLAGVAVFLVGTIGLAGFGLLLAFFRALVRRDALNTEAGMAQVAQDAGLSAFLYGWIGCFYLGVLLIALGLLLARRTSVWVPVLLLVFVAMFPLADALGRVGQAIQLMALALGLTGVAIAAATAGTNNRDAEYSLSS